MPTRVAETGLLTATTLTIIAILAIITALGILWGMRLQRARRRADHIEIDRVETESSEEPVASALTTDEGAPSPQSRRPPVAPAPPPLAATPTVATPADPAPQPSLADEPVAAAAPLDASPASEAAPERVAATSADGDRPVTDIKGLGPKVAARLAELGIANVAQIAALDAGEAERVDAQLGPFTGRMARDRWIEQARFLAAGDVKGFEAVFGRL